MKHNKLTRWAALILAAALTLSLTCLLYTSGPVADLKAALHHGHTALGEVAADKLSRLPPGHHIDKIGAAFAGGLVFKIPVHRQREGGHRGCLLYTSRCV